MKIITVPHPALKEVSEPVTQVDKKLIKFIKDLEMTLLHKKNPEGVGLSAIQVAKPWRIFSTYLDHDRPQSIRTYINPVIISQSKKLTLGRRPRRPFLEGCLSMPHLFGPVWRHQKVTLEFHKINLESMSLEVDQEKFTDFDARVIQHEIDHLDGILFTDRAIEQELPIFTEEDGDLVEIKVE